MRLSVCLGGHTYSFRDVRDVMGKANEEKSGDQLCGVAAQTPQERVAARIVLSEMSVKEICEHPAVPYEQDEVTRLILDGLNLPIYREYQNMTIGSFGSGFSPLRRRSSRVWAAVFPARSLPPCAS